MKPQPKFYHIEREHGLLSKLFQAKFVYSQQQCSSHQAYLIPLFHPLPSQQAGFTIEDIRVTHALAADMIFKAGNSLGVPVSTTVLAQILFHFYYSRVTFIHNDMRDAMIGAMYLACKSQQTLCHRYQVVAVFDYIFKAYEGLQKNVKAIDTHSTEYDFMKNQTLIKSQNDILFQFGFQVYRLLDLPHRYIGAILNLFQRHPKFSQFSKKSWLTLNDLYFTTVCLHFPSQIIATSAVYIAMKECGASFPDAPWWILMETYEEAIKYIETELQAVRGAKELTNFSHVCKRINEVSESHHGLLNVFPVPYYRKIMLQKRNKLSITKSQPIQIIDPTENDPTNKKTINQESGKMDEEKNDQEVQRQSILNQPQIEEIEQKTEKPQIDKKDLLNKINLTFKKHGGKLDQKIKRERERDQEDEEELRVLAQLRKKVKANQEARKNG